ncbi:MAG: hypothetical protein VX259_06260, partial [Pseudomonadota bacterium]|nr:hypothetical protein [Pseudomonadota bacterium]
MKSWRSPMKGRKHRRRGLLLWLVPVILGVASCSVQAADYPQADYQGAPITLNFQDVEVRSVLSVLSDFTGLNIVVSDSVSGRVT